MTVSSAASRPVALSGACTRLALILILALAPGQPVHAAPAAKAGVELVKGGQYYHRPGHLAVDEPTASTREAAIADGFAPCPECMPPDSAYYRALLAERRAGPLYQRIQIPLSQEAAELISSGPPAPAATAIPSRPAPPPAFELPADGLPVPGTGGLLKVPTFKGSGGIIAIPYPMGGYGIVQPPITGPAAPPAGDPAPSAR